MKSIKNYFAVVIVSLMTVMCFSSCTLAAYAQDDMYGNEISYSTIVTYGTPYYIGDVLSYYIYNGWYYYPYMWNNHWYFHPYRYMQPRGFVFHPQPGFRPGHNHPGNFGPRGNNRNFGPRNFGSMRSSTRITGGNNGGFSGNHQPSHSFSMPQGGSRSMGGMSHGSSQGGGHFGGGHSGGGHR